MLCSNLAKIPGKPLRETQHVATKGQICWVVLFSSQDPSLWTYYESWTQGCRHVHLIVFSHDFFPHIYSGRSYKWESDIVLWWVVKTMESSKHQNNYLEVVTRFKWGQITQPVEVANIKTQRFSNRNPTAVGGLGNLVDLLGDLIVSWSSTFDRSNPGKKAMPINVLYYIIVFIYFLNLLLFKYFFVCMMIHDVAR